jgi:uncharacterized protein DUF4838/glycosyl hydrolase family 67
MIENGPLPGRKHAVTALFGLALIVSLSAQGDLLLATEGVSDYVIVLAEDALAPEQNAARELQKHLKAVTGADMPIQTEGKTPDNAKQIIVGPCTRLRSAFPDLDLASLGTDGIVMKTRGTTLFLAGGHPRGTLYAVYTFLEDVVGCRWWSSTVGFTPERPTLRISAQDKVYVPAVLSREVYFRDAFDPMYAVRSKCNGHHSKIPPEYGGHYTITGFVHTFDRLLPAAEHYEQHPEWFSEIGGKRQDGLSQLCLTNDEMRAELVKKALKWIRNDPEAGIISISQNDCHGRCQCTKCRALEAQEESPAGPLIHFVNAVAEEIEKEFPDTLVETLAYQYTRKAPKHVEPRKNVLIRLCSIECSFSQPLASGEQNARFKRDMTAWSAISHQLYVWDYVTNFRSYILPHPNLRVIAPNIRFFVENKTIGLFEQGDAQCTCSDFPELRAWLISHLMWDPSLDDRTLINTFMRGYYGPAADPLLAYIDLIHGAVSTSGAALRCFMMDTSTWFGLDDITKATALFDRAEKAAGGDPLLLKRVQRARMPLDHVWLNRYRSLERAAKLRNVAFSGPKDPLAFCERFIKRAHAFKVGSFREGQSFTHLEPLLRGRLQPPGPPPELCKNLPQTDWLDANESSFSLYRVGTCASYVDDAAASNQRAVRMPANHRDWAIQYTISGEVALLGPVHVYAALRCAAIAQTGPALQLGIYDAVEPKHVASRTVTIEEAGGTDYRVVDLGAYDLNPNMYIWAAPMGNPEAVEAVYVDRFFFVRVK